MDALSPDRLHECSGCGLTSTFTFEQDGTGTWWCLVCTRLLMASAAFHERWRDPTVTAHRRHYRTVPFCDWCRFDGAAA